MLIRVFCFLFFLSSLVDAMPLLGNELNNPGVQAQLDQLLSWDHDGSNFKTYELNTTKARYDVFFGLTDKDALRTYRKSKFGILDGNLLKSKFRARGVGNVHWLMYNKSMKIRLKDQDGNKRIVNLNTINSDSGLVDMIAYKIYQQEGLVAPNMALSDLFINGNYNGLKERLENMDDDFLANRQIPLGHMYRENYASSLTSFKNWNKNSYRETWEKQTLTKEDNFEDWLVFLQVNAEDDDEVFFRYIEKYLDMDDYLKWYALTNWMGGHHNTDHNLVFINDFRHQKFRQVGYDTLGFQKTRSTMPVTFFSNHFSSRILTKPEYYFRVNKHIYEILQGKTSKESFFELVENSYADLSKALNGRLKYPSTGHFKSSLVNDVGTVSFMDSMIHMGGVARAEAVNSMGTLKNLESLNLELYSFVESRRKYLMAEFDDSIVNLNFVSDDKFLGDELNLTELVGPSGRIKLPLSFLELIVKGGAGVKIEEIVVGVSQAFWQRGLISVDLCYDKNFNRKKDEEEQCLASKRILKGKRISFTNDGSLPLLLPKLDSTQGFSVGYKESVWGSRKLTHAAKQYGFNLMFSFSDEVIIDFSELKINLESVRLAGALTGNEILVSEKPLLLNSKDYMVGPGQNIFIDPLFSKNIEGIDNAKMEWKGLPDWLVAGNGGEVISGKGPRILPTQIHIALKLKVNDRAYEYPFTLHVENWSGRIGNFFSYIDTEWSFFMDGGLLRTEIYSRFRELLKKWYFKFDAVWDLFFDFESIFNKRGFRIDQSWVASDVLPENEKIIWGPEAVNIKETVVLPASSTLSIKPGTHIKISAGKAIIFHGVVKAIGKPKSKIIFTSSKPGHSFGSLIFNQWSMLGSEFTDVIIEKGKDFFWKERFYSGALSAYNTPVHLKRVMFRENKGDDAFNAKYSNSIVESSMFIDNAADAIDFDFSAGVIRNNIFVGNGNDGIDLGTSLPLIEGNWIEKSGDKAISIGEESKPVVRNNVLYGNKTGIAIKDKAFPEINNILFFDNKTAISMYIKKRKFSKPYASVSKSMLISNENDLNLLDDTKLDLESLYINKDRGLTSDLTLEKIYSIFLEKNMKIKKTNRLNSDNIKKVFVNREMFSKGILR
jgi:hypothetical protein